MPNQFQKTPISSLRATSAGLQAVKAGARSPGLAASDLVWSRLKDDLE